MNTREIIDRAINSLEPEKLGLIAIASAIHDLAEVIESKRI